MFLSLQVVSGRTCGFFYIIKMPTLCATVLTCLQLLKWSSLTWPGKKCSHHFECHLVSWLPQVLLLHCVPLHPRWLHPCHPTCRQWHLPHSDLPPTWHHLQDWGGGCEEGRQSRRTEGKGHFKDLCVARCIHASESGNCTSRGIGTDSLVNDYQW